MMFCIVEYYAALDHITPYSCGTTTVSPQLSLAYHQLFDRHNVSYQKRIIPSYSFYIK